MTNQRPTANALQRPSEEPLITPDPSPTAQRHSGRFDALDSLRGVSACLVVLFHFASTGWLHRQPIIAHGGLFVDFFFVLSGFVIAAGYRERLSTGFPVGRFLLLRLGRIYPLHFVVLLAFVALEIFNALVPGLTIRPPFTGSRTVQDLIASLLLVQGYVWNTPAWSIAVEFWTYVIAAVVFARTGRRASLAMLVLVAGALAGLIIPATPFAASLLRCIYAFGLGTLAWALFPAIRGWLIFRGFATLTLLELAAATAVVAVVTGPNLNSLACPPVFMLAVLVFATEGGAVSALLRAKPMLLLGTLSYSIYLDHAFVQGRMLDVIGLVGHREGLATVAASPNGFKFLTVGPLAADLFTLLMLALVVAVAYATYHLVERPAREWSRARLLGPGKTSSNPSAEQLARAN